MTGGSFISFNKIKEYFIGLIYPRRCPICDTIIEEKNKLICSECKEKPVVISEPRCIKCSKPLISNVQEFCFDCSNRKHYYKKGFALWLYDDSMKKSITKFKYFGKKEYVNFYAEHLSALCNSIIKDNNIQAIVPIPIHNKKLNIRGYNQAEVLARELGKLTNTDVICDILERHINTKPQKELNNIERRKNLEKAFRIDLDKIKSYSNIKKILLIDDIYTTGSTIDMCAKKLLNVNIEEVYFLCICIGNGK